MSKSLPTKRSAAGAAAGSLNAASDAQSVSTSRKRRVTTLCHETDRGASRHVADPGVLADLTVRDNSTSPPPPSTVPTTSLNCNTAAALVKPVQGKSRNALRTKYHLKSY